MISAVCDRYNIGISLTSTYSRLMIQIGYNPFKSSACKYNNLSGGVTQPSRLRVRIFVLILLVLASMHTAY